MQPVVQVVRTREALEAIVPAWEELAAQACEANPFYEHWILLPALRAQGDGSLHCVCVWQGERLIGAVNADGLESYFRALNAR